MNRSRTPLRILVGVAVVLSMSACAIVGGNDNDTSLDGDLSWRVEGPDGITVHIWRSSWDGETRNSSAVTSAEISDGSASGDLENGDYVGYQLRASTDFGEEPDSFTLQLLSNGNVLGETSESTSEGTWVVEVGELPSNDYF